MTVIRLKLAVRWGAVSAGPQLIRSVHSWSSRVISGQTGSSTGCNTRHERGGEAGPMSCVAAVGPASKSPSALASNS